MSKQDNPAEEAVGCIVGAVVQLKPDACENADGNKSADVRQQLAQLEGVDIHAEDEQSRLVITLEAASSRAVMNLTEDIQNLNGVLSVTPVYQHCEENQQQDKQQEQHGGWQWR